MTHTDPLEQESSQTWQRREQLIRRFEAAWNNGAPPSIDDFLPSADADRRAVLIELVHADLERRHKAGDLVRVECYLERYPELAGEPAVALDLIAAEIRQRRAAGSVLDLESYLERFPTFHVELWALWDAESASGVRTIAAAGAQAEAPAPLPAVPGYEVQRFIARGGMGAVYQARQERLDRTVALKILVPEAAERDVFAERFGREARTLARLNHPHIIAVHDFGESAGQYYLVMEFVDGQDLRPRLRAGHLNLDLALRIIGQVCEALQYAHEAGVVHRDIKPENILLDRKDRVKVADFGLAKLLHGAPAGTLTGSQQAVGTLHYMAPEQLQRPLEVGPAADVYSLGVLFYEMLTGDLPMGRFAPPSQLAPIDPRLDDIILRMLAKEPEHRFASIADVQVALDGLPIATPTRRASECFAPALAGASGWSEKPQLTDGLSTRVFLGATLVFLVGWIITAAAANYAYVGLGGAAVVMALLAGLVTLRGVTRLPELAAELLSRRRGVAVGNTALAVGLFLLGFVALLAAQFVWWDRSTIDPSTLATAYRGREVSLLQELHVYAKETPKVVLMTAHASVSGEDRMALWLAVSSVLLLLGAAMVGLDTERYRHRWALHWQPALALTTAFLLPLPVLQVLSGLIADGGAVGLHKEYDHTPNRQHRSDADFDQTLAALQTWANDNDYELAERGSWTLEALPERRPVVRLCWLEVRSRSLFDRWRITWSGPIRRRPLLRIQCLSNLSPTETLVRIDPGVLWKGATVPVERDAVIASLEAALEARHE